MMGALAATPLSFTRLLSAAPPKPLLPSPHRRPFLPAPLKALKDSQDDSAQPLSVEQLEDKLGMRKRSRKNKPSDSPPPKPPPPKDWDSMTLAEKAWEVYVGEKGALFWLNKVAYAAIFVIVGGWILFRFIGPALGWYQLESPLLPPDQVFGGSK